MAFYALRFRFWKATRAVHLTMSDRERRYLRWLSDVVSGKAELAAAAAGMGRSSQQARRRLKRYRAQGDAGLAQSLRGKASTPTPETIWVILDLLEARTQHSRP